MEEITQSMCKDAARFWELKCRSIHKKIDRLEQLLATGHRLSKQDGLWWLFDSKGEGIVSGETLYAMLMEVSDGQDVAE